MLGFPCEGECAGAGSAVEGAQMRDGPCFMSHVQEHVHMLQVFKLNGFWTTEVDDGLFDSRRADSKRRAGGGYLRAHPRHRMGEGSSLLYLGHCFTLHSLK